MKILILLIFVCLVLVGSAVAFFAWTVRQGTFDHADRLALLPLEEERTNTAKQQREEDGNAANRL